MKRATGASASCNYEGVRGHPKVLHCVAMIWYDHVLFARERLRGPGDASPNRVIYNSQGLSFFVSSTEGNLTIL